MSAMKSGCHFLLGSNRLLLRDKGILLSLPVRRSFLTSICSLRNHSFRHQSTTSTRNVSMSEESSTSTSPAAQHILTPTSSTNMDMNRMKYGGSVAVGARRGVGFLAEMESIKEQPMDASTLDFESPLEVILYPDPRLRAPNKLITDFKDPRLLSLVTEMLDAMYRTDGVGLAAPQVGVNVRLMVYNPKGVRGEGKEYVLINPRLVKTTKVTVADREGCLSFPNIYADVERADGVKVDAQDIQGRKFTLSLKGFQARIFQHEYDHLQGTLFFERMNPEILETVRQDLLDLESLYEERMQQKRPETVGSTPVPDVV